MADLIDFASYRAKNVVPITTDAFVEAEIACPSKSQASEPELTPLKKLALACREEAARLPQAALE